MVSLENKTAWVIGLGLSGRAAADLLLARGAGVVATDDSDSEALRKSVQPLIERGADIRLGGASVPDDSFDVAVLSPGVAPEHPCVVAARQRGIPVISELELGYQQCLALNVSITGTNGKTTTTELIERVINANHLKTMAAGNIGTPLCAVAEQTRTLDFVTLEVSSFQLETIQYFRPAVAVLLNITPDHLDRYASMDDYARAKGKLFQNQQPFDWAIVQAQALERLKELNISLRSKIITFSATTENADIYLDRSLIVSRIEGWAGPLVNMDDVQLRGVHNAENIMATLAVGRVLRLPLEGVLDAIRSYEPAKHRCEFIAEINGVQFVNDSKATNVDAVAKALTAMPRPGGLREPNVWLLAGGKDKGFDFHDIGPLLAERVKGAFLFGETREKIRAAWSLFTPCTAVSTLLEALSEAVKHAVPGDVVLLSPACSSFDQFQNYQHRGDVFRHGVMQLAAEGDHAAGPVAVSPID